MHRVPKGHVCNLSTVFPPELIHISLRHLSKGTSLTSLAKVMHKTHPCFQRASRVDNIAPSPSEENHMIPLRDSDFLYE